MAQPPLLPTALLRLDALDPSPVERAIIDALRETDLGARGHS